MQLCLNGIVRNEADKIERCLRSVVNYIDCYVIVDTGSTDGTPAKIKAFFDRAGISGEIHHVPFENFEQARNAALTAARKSNLYWDYLLLVDADMELVAMDQRWLATATQMNGLSYDMQQRAGHLHYMNRRLVNRTATGNYIGVTHEYLDVESAGALTGAYFVDHADGSNRKEKYTRDIALLEKALEKEPNNGRYWFYLAQSYRDAGLFTHAVSAYQRRVAIGGWDEEVWNAQMNIAHCLASLKDEEGFVREMLTAYNMRPSRAETLYDLAKHYRLKGKNALATLYAEAGMAVPYSKDSLFVSDYVYITGLREEFAITAFYNEQKRQRGFQVCNELALDRKGTPHSREQARANLFYYLQPLSAMLPYFVAHRIPFTAPDGYTAMNPSVAAIRRDPTKAPEITAIVRTVNYTINERGQYLIRGSDGTASGDNPIHTRNFLVRLSATFEVLSSKEIMVPLYEPKYNMVRGFEDMRLFQWGDDLWVSACVRDMNPQGWCEQVRAKIEEAATTAYIGTWHRMLPKERDNEKNWVPRVSGDNLQFVYRLGALVDPDGKTISVKPTTQDTDHISGGSQSIPFKGGWLSVVHEARAHPDGSGRRYYQHRFALTTEGGDVKLSLPFYLHDKQIEFVAGLARHPNGNRLMISYGVRDCEAWIATIDTGDVLNRMFP